MTISGITKTVLVVSLSAFFAGYAHEAMSHGRLVPGSKLPPRDPTTRGRTQAPCGGTARTANVVELTAGSQVEIEYEESANHNGNKFRIAFSPANDEGFDDNILMDNLPDNGAPQKYKQMITVPNVPCDACTIQMIYDAGNTWYSCTDIKIVEAVQNQAPVAAIVAQVTEGKVPLRTSFDASSSTDDAGIQTYEWDFGDGQSGTGPIVSHEYTTEGDYTVTLTTTDAEGLSSTTTQTVNALSVDALIAEIEASEFKGLTPFSVTISSANAEENLKYSWKIDGVAAPAYDNQAQFTHKFEKPGAHSIDLLVTDANGKSDEKSMTVIAQYNAESMLPDDFVSLLQVDFDEIDLNKDSLLSFEEIKDTVSGVRNDLLPEIDVDGDQLISKSELEDFSGSNSGADDVGSGQSAPSSLAGSAGLFSLLLLVFAPMSRRAKKKS